MTEESFFGIEKKVAIKENDAVLNICVCRKQMWFCWFVPDVKSSRPILLFLVEQLLFFIISEVSAQHPLHPKHVRKLIFTI